MVACTNSFSWEKNEVQDSQLLDGRLLLSLSPSWKEMGYSWEKGRNAGENGPLKPYPHWDSEGCNTIIESLVKL